MKYMLIDTTDEKVDGLWLPTEQPDIPTLKCFMDIFMEKYNPIKSGRELCRQCPECNGEDTPTRWTEYCPYCKHGTQYFTVGDVKPITVFDYIQDGETAKAIKLAFP